MRTQVIVGMAILAATIAQADYRNVDPPEKAAAAESAQAGAYLPESVTRPPPGGHLEVEMVTAGGRTNAIRGVGRGPITTMLAKDRVRLILRKPGLSEGSWVTVATQNGGRVNGKVATDVAVGPGGRFEVVYDVGRYGGRYTVAVTCGGVHETLTFWVDESEDIDKAPERQGRGGAK